MYYIIHIAACNIIHIAAIKLYKRKGMMSARFRTMVPQIEWYV